MDKLKVLILIDVFGWAFDFVANGIQKYSKHEVTIKRWNEVVEQDKKFDVLFSMNDSCWFALGHQKQKWFEGLTRKCVGIRGEEMPSDRILNGWTIATVNKRIYNGLIRIENLPVKGVYLCRNGVDTDIFKPANRINRENKLVVGWAGNPTSPLKRFHLLSKLDKSQFSLSTMTRWGPQFFQKGRSRQEMIDFYPKIDTFINVSIHEGMPQSILEAAATKLPLVVTDVGGMPEFVDSEWIVPANPEKVVVEELNRKLQILKDDYNLRVKVGEANYKKIVDEWSWKHRVKEYDKMFEECK